MHIVFYMQKILLKLEKKSHNITSCRLSGSCHGTKTLFLTGLTHLIRLVGQSSVPSSAAALSSTSVCEEVSQHVATWTALHSNLDTYNYRPCNIYSYVTLAFSFFSMAPRAGVEPSVYSSVNCEFSTMLTEWPDLEISSSSNIW